MPEALAGVPQTDGILWLALAVVVAGLVRGFSGFGSAMIIMPVASSVLSPFAALAFLTVVEFFGPLPNLSSALRFGRLRDVLRLDLGALVAMPLGLLALGAMDPEIFGWAVSLIVLALLALLILGWRYSGELSARTTVGVGALGGFLAGVSGLPGPPVIMLYMASRMPVAVIRANFLLYLLSIDVMMIVIFLGVGLLSFEAVMIGAFLVLPYMAANRAGAWLFDPKAEGTFRRVAYLVIAASAILGLPVWAA